MVEPRSSIAGFPAFRADGEGDRWPWPLVFLHGAFDDHTGFANYVRFFSAVGFDCYAASYRGRQSVPPERACGLHVEHYLDDALRVLGELGPEVIVVGHSLGGLLAQKVAEAGRCRAAVLLAPAPPRPLIPQPRSLPALLPNMPKIVLGRSFLISYASAASVLLNRVPEADRRRIYDGLVPESGLVFRQLTIGTMRVDASRVRCPLLCIRGIDDRVISARLMRGTAKRYAADLKEYDRHGHWLFQEPGWEVPAGDILAWLERLPNRR